MLMEHGANMVSRELTWRDVNVWRRGPSQASQHNNKYCLTAVLSFKTLEGEGFGGRAQNSNSKP